MARYSAAHLTDAAAAGIARAVELARGLPLGSVEVKTSRGSASRTVLHVRTPDGRFHRWIDDAICEDVTFAWRTVVFWRTQVDRLADLIAQNKAQREAAAQLAQQRTTARKRKRRTVQVQAGGYRRALALTGLPE